MVKIRTGDLKKATEGTIMAAQEQAIRTCMIRETIDKENESPPLHGMRQ